MISVIVPVYNVENVLHYCIDSILNQTYKDFELILVDDGSTDKSGKICDKYADKDSRIRVFHKENGGVSSARNVGIDNANGEYICFVDSDDYVCTVYLEELVKCKNKKKSDNVWCSFIPTDSYEVSKSYLSKTELTYKSYKRSDIMLLHSKWLDACPFCKLYSKRLIEVGNLRFNESISIAEDLLFNLEYIDLSEGNITVVEGQLYFYVNINEESLTKKFHKDLKTAYLFLMSEMENYLVRWNCSTIDMDAFYNYSYFLFESVLENTYHKDSIINNKIKYNDEIIKSKEFCDTLNRTTCFINPFVRIAYSLQSYRLILFYKRMVESIKKLKQSIIHRK